ncbi:hypothetical protein MCOR07_008548 [Pyricularia oryzae]|uniref:Uncharacterized protein n=2 Tax=Pyricularia TaxID=48558 RepID=A0ABQ8NK46_PYRGI|nr:hypothetical protein MCOR19_007434 [Pyricularia oryzae]KAI6298299.1 hypothetical protein MCOR33_005577 [Pyricularia grisea]KAI6285344.1 hypothetical protein MCOR26_001581 [Pyricularia oryzae]KAI6339905.1 hypothetical protein MCOR30_002660 [Pyricularia oryzae]KAI6345072.1 hypothetical protein MCOR28_003828 [Pyricularia oryzae]
MDSDTDVGSLPSKLGPFKLDSRSPSKCTTSEDEQVPEKTAKEFGLQPKEMTASWTPGHKGTNDQTFTSSSQLPPELLSRATYQPESAKPLSVSQPSASCNKAPASRCFHESIDNANILSFQAMDYRQDTRGTASLGSNFRREQRVTPPCSPHRLKSTYGVGSTPTPIRGDFIEVSSPAKIPSPPSQPDEFSAHGVTLHLSLTESQMDRLTEVISRPNSPHKGSRRGRDADVAKEGLQRSHIRAFSEDEILTTPPLVRSQRDALDSLVRKNASTRSRSHFRYNEQHAPSTMQADTSASFADRAASSLRSRSPAKKFTRTEKGRHVNDGYSPYTTSSIAQRRGVPHPLVDTMTAQQQGSPSHRRTPIEILRNDDSSAYSRSWQTITHTTRDDSPSRVTFQEHPSSSIYSVFEEQGDYDDDGSMAHLTPLPARNAAGAMAEADILRSLAEYESLYSRSGLSQQPQAQKPGDPKLLSIKTGIGQIEQFPRIYSPLTPYIESMEDKIPRRKVLIGEHGWLERTGVPTEDGHGNASAAPQQQPPKKGIFESLKKVAKEVVELADMKTSARGPHRPSNKRPPNRLDISLNPREQSLFYCELEFLMTTALDGYLTTQFQAGRVQADKLSKVADAWRQKGRPGVVGFRYDLETQLDIMLLHLYDFKFYGADCTSPAVVTGLLEMVKTDARAMRVRTFCQPDLVMAKQLLDAQKLFNILGCREHLQLQLHETVRFFKLVVNPEKDVHPETADKARDDGSGSPARGSPRCTGRSRDQQMRCSDRRWQSQSPARKR